MEELDKDAGTIHLQGESGPLFTLEAAHEFQNADLQYFLDTSSDSTVVLGNTSWKQFDLADGYCDGQDCTGALLALQHGKKGVLYRVVMEVETGQTWIEPLFWEIIEPFKVTR